MAEREQVDIAVIGAGPAGMAAALRASEAGLGVTLLDDHPAAGGAVWRGLANATGARKQRLNRDYPAGFEMLDQLDGTTFSRKFNAKVWEVTRDRVISYSQDGVARQMSARRIILATGALERPMPFPGWTLPGVMTAGAAQIMLKTSGLTPTGPVVMAGSGPLLYLVGAQLLDAGHPPAALIDTTPFGNRFQALGHMGVRFSAWALISEGLTWQRRLRHAGITLYRGVSGLEACGDHRVGTVTFKHRGSPVALSCSTLLIHAGVVPNVQLSRAIGLAHIWDQGGLAWRPETDDMGRTEIDGIVIAGDGAGMAGADAAVSSGQLAALAALGGLAEIAEIEIARTKDALAHHRKNRPVLDALFAPRAEFLRPADDTIVCRCESVTAGQVRQLVEQGCGDPNAVKSISRAGMGPCQGRYCGLTVSQLVAEMRDISPAEAGYFRLRAPATPVTLAELAGLELPEDGDGGS